MKIAIATFGCKLNQYESQLMAQQLREKGIEIVDLNQNCDFYIINSCAVTSKASKESRQLAKKLSRKGKIIYTGCDSYLEENQKNFYALVGNSYKHDIIKVIKNKVNDISEKTKNYPINKPILTHENRSRAFVKIQEGCNNHCTYCIIPFLRGIQRDKPYHTVLKEIENLSEKFSEIVITGTNIGSYNNFKKLLIKIDSLKGNFRIRISSIEPMYVDEELINIVANGRFAKHLHIPLQSGSDKILKTMNRNYTTNQYERIVNYCHKKGIFVGTDIIVGFFGETDEEFEKTYRFIERLPVSFGHVFSYSKRPLTAAKKLSTTLPSGSVVKQRSKILRNLFIRKKTDSIKSMLNKEAEVVVETTKVKTFKGEFYKAITSWYFPVLVREFKKSLKKGILETFDGNFAYLKWQD